MRIVMMKTLGPVLDQAGIGMTLPSGRRLSLPADDQSPDIHFTNWQDCYRLLATPTLGLAEAYINGRLIFHRGDLYQLLDRAAQTIGSRGFPLTARLRMRLEKPLRRLMQLNARRQSADNVHHHYDLGSDLYRLFLDQDWQYSCAYFRHGDESLDQAQQEKQAHIARKLRLKPGLRVLDIGSGWGGLACHLARHHAVKVNGLTLSHDQLAAARQRADTDNETVRFFLRDYRDEKGLYDRIVSVGMFEHVGIGNYRQFFKKLRSCLKPDGVALIHTIGNSRPTHTADPFIRKYIFPGGFIPSLSEIMPAVEASGLMLADLEVLRGHYARTLQHWRQRFEANRHQVVQLYDERFARIWAFYLAGCEVSFRHLGLVVFQLQLVADPAQVPITRDYLYNDTADRESRLAE